MSKKAKKQLRPRPDENELWAVRFQWGLAEVVYFKTVNRSIEELMPKANAYAEANFSSGWDRQIKEIRHLGLLN